MGKHERPFTPDALAQRWDCSGETIRAMIRRGELPAFRVGNSYRITAQTVEAHECGTIAWGDSMDDGSSSGTKQTDAGVDFGLRLARAKRLKEKRAT